VSLILQLHQLMFFVVLALGAAMLICGLALSWLARGARVDEDAAAGMSGSVGGSLGLVRTIFRRVTAITAGAGVVQAILGGLLFLGGKRPADNLHLVYGLIVLIAIPVAYAYSDQKQVRRDIIIMTIAAVAIIGAAIRAFVTG
jgi:ABC-type Mn2+/Zn2+ transport system permease subunit